MKPLATTIFTCGLLLSFTLASYAQERLPALRAAAAIESAEPKVPALAARLEDEVIDYSGDAALVYEVGGALVQAFGVRITPSLSGRITQVEFPLYDGPLSGNVSAPGISGSGILRLRLVNIDDFNADIAFSPTIDSLDVPFSALSSDLVNYANSIDLSDRAFNVTEGEDVVFVLHVVEESQDGFLNFLTDNGTADTTNTAYYPARSVFHFNGDAEDPAGFYIALDFDGVNNANVLARFTLSDEAPVAVEPVGEGVPASFALMPNYPNPFNPATTIEFALDQSGPASLRIFDLLGREVDVLVDETLAAGRYRVAFDGHHLPSGLYMYLLTAGAATQERMLTLLK